MQDYPKTNKQITANEMEVGGIWNGIQVSGSIMASPGDAWSPLPPAYESGVL